jgi:hypothetical protein
MWRSIVIGKFSTPLLVTFRLQLVIIERVSHWYQHVYGIPKLAILPLTKFRSREMVLRLHPPKSDTISLG